MVSVIVPVYNVEQYLARCVESLLSQTYSDFELILVDDGSPDRCGAMCDLFAEKDHRVKVIHKANGGLSDARNAGLAISSGSYIAFVDSDDWVAPQYLAQMLHVCEKTNSEICECEALLTSGEMNGSSSGPEHIILTYSTEQAIKLLIQDKVFHQHVWNKLYRRDCVDGLQFPVGKTHEDEFWTYQVFGKAKTVSKVSDCLYYYFQRADSIMGIGYNLRRLDALEAKCCRQKYIEKTFPDLTEVAAINLFSSCIYSGQMSLRYLSGSEQKQAIQAIDKIRGSCTPDRKTLKTLNGSQRLWIRLAVFDFWRLCRIKNLLRKGY